MKKIKIFSGNWAVNDVKDSTDLFVFGDNLQRVGKGGQAIIRDLPNSIGLVTKKEPNNNPESFFNDSELDKNQICILQDILDIKYKQILGSQLVFSEGGYGTGLSKLPEFAPLTFSKLNKLLINFFHYDNLTGVVKTSVPSYNQIINGKYISLNEIERPTSNLLFNSEYLDKDIYTIYDLIKSECKISFVTDSKFIEDTVILFTDGNKDYLICRVIHDSIPTTLISDISRFEGYKLDDIDNTCYITFFEYISTLDPKTGKMVYNERFFNFGNSLAKESVEKNTTISIEEKVNNLEKKVDLLFEFLKDKLG